MTIVILCICIVWILAGSRENALVPYLLVQAFVPWGQRVYLAGMNFTIIRILICIGLFRIILRKDSVQFRLTNLDKVFFFYSFVSFIAYSLQVPDAASVVNSLGVALDTLGGYLVVRLMVRDDHDVETVVGTMMFLSFVIALLFLYESSTGNNPFSAFGGITGTSEQRGGRVRAQGAYAHAIIGGAYWASAFPLMVGYRLRAGRRRMEFYLAAICCMLIVFLSASSTPMMALAVGVAASILYYQRSSVNTLLLAGLSALIGLAFVMKHPIWFIFAKIDLAGGSTGYYRYLLIDNFFRNWNEWVIVGVRDTYHWGVDLNLANTSQGMSDITNQYIFEGVRSGLLGMASFIASIVIAFRYVGRLISLAPNDDSRHHYWAIGVALLVHATNFLGISYFGQVKFVWGMTLAFCASLFQNHCLAISPIDNAPVLQRSA